MVALPSTPKLSSPDQLSRNKINLANGTAPTNGAPLEIQISTSTPTNMPPSGVLSVWATSAGLQTSPDGGTTVTPAGGAVVVQIPFVGNQAANAVFIANRAYTVTAVRAVNTVINGAAGTVDIRKCTGTQAPSAGATVLNAAFDLTTTANTVTTVALTATTANLSLAAGDRLATVPSGTLSADVAFLEVFLNPA